MRPAPQSSSSPSLANLLDRPLEQRVREFRYRFSQAIVFGLPVIGLEYLGPQLGGPESGRWIGVLQALLGGWVLYVAAAGMLFEGILRLLRRRVTADLIVALVAAGTYLFSLVSVLHVFVVGTIWYRPLLFHVSVAVLALWTGVQWARGVRRIRTIHADSPI